jgi:hypothetical protein
MQHLEHTVLHTSSDPPSWFSNASTTSTMKLPGSGSTCDQYAQMRTRVAPTPRSCGMKMLDLPNSP